MLRGSLLLSCSFFCLGNKKSITVVEEALTMDDKFSHGQNIIWVII